MIRVMYDNLYFEALKCNDKYVLYRPGYIIPNIEIEKCVHLPDINDVPYDVIEDIIVYFENNLEQYEIKGVYRASEHPDDNYLYMVVAYNKKSNVYACWTSWSQVYKSLNYGHYNIERLEDCFSILMDYYHRLSF